MMYMPMPAMIDDRGDDTDDSTSLSADSDAEESDA